jgi:hypothetical protein
MPARRKWKVLLPFGVLVLATLFSTVYLVHYYGETRPTTVEPGRPHAVKVHSRTVYLTPTEYDLAFATHAMAIVSVGTFVGLALKPSSSKR